MKVRPGMPVAVKDWTPPAEQVAVINKLTVKKD
jgi:hypothetical protein